jgi:hypothetical protein
VEKSQAKKKEKSGEKEYHRIYAHAEQRHRDKLKNKREKKSIKLNDKDNQRNM